MEKATKVFDKQTITSMLKEQDRSGRSIVRLSFIKEDQDLFEEVLGVLESFIDKEEIADLMMLTDLCGCFCFYHGLDGYSIKGFTSVMSKVKLFLSKPQQQLFLRARDQERRNILHMAAKKIKDDPTIETFFQNVKDVFDNTDLRDMMMEQNYSGCTALLTAAGKSNPNLLQKLFNGLQEIMPNEIDRLMKIFDNKGNNLLFLALDSDLGSLQLTLGFIDRFASEHE